MISSDRAFELLKAAGTNLGEVRIRESDVTVAGGLVLHGIDTEQLHHLLIPLGAEEEGVEDRNSAGVQLRIRTLMEGPNARRFLDAVCLIPRLNGLFSTVADEMLAAIRTAPTDPSLACHGVLDRWRELLERPRSTLLGPEQLAGLLAELAWIERIASIAPQGALSAWAAAHGARHDFTKGSEALEVKAILTREGRLVEIHGDRQLEAPKQAVLYLSIFRFERAPDGRDSVPLAIERIAASGVARVDFFRLLLQRGYDSREEEAYSKVRFNLTESRLYMVDDVFPKIIPESFKHGTLPPGVMQIRYVIDLTGEPPHPLPNAAWDDLASRMARG
jgi:hypothetical protein